MNLKKEIKSLQSNSPLKKDYEVAKANGNCKCKQPLSIFAGPGREFCCKCNKSVKN